MDTVFNISGVYENTAFGFKEGLEIIDLKENEGMCGYCSQETEEAVRRLVSSMPLEAVHFLDNGNYHYISKFFLEKIEKDFDLVLFDNHTDMQKSRILPVLSCGSWVIDSLEDENIKLKRVILIGPEKNFSENMPSEGEWELVKDRVIFASDKEALKSISFSRPVYISVDKDVLSEAEIKVNWDQGHMTVKELEDLIGSIKGKAEVIGMDVCGEPSAEDENSFAASNDINERLKSLKKGTVVF